VTIDSSRTATTEQQNRPVQQQHDDRLQQVFEGAEQAATGTWQKWKNCVRRCSKRMRST
jgi:hypothetical protein